MITSILLASTILATPVETAPKSEESTVTQIEKAITGAYSSIFESPKAKAAVPPPKSAMPKGTATEGSGSISASGDKHVIELKFNGEPMYKRQSGAGFMTLVFSSGIELRAPSIPEASRGVIKNVFANSGGTLRLRIEYDKEYQAVLADKIDRLVIEVKPKAAAKADEAKKAEEEKKAEEKKVADKKEADKKEADKKKAAEEEKKKKAAADKKAEEKKKADAKKADAKKAEEKKKAEAAKLKAEKEKKEAAAKKAEQGKSDADKKAEEEKKKTAEAEKLKAEEAKKAAAAKKAEEDKKKADEAKKAADNKKLQAAEPAAAPEIELPETTASSVQESKPEVVKDAKISFTKSGVVEQVKFDFPKMPAAAVFERFGYVWVVFDASANPAMPKLDGSEIFSGIEKVKSDAMAYKLVMKNAADITATPSGNSWVIEGNPDADATGRNIRVNASGDNWVMNAKGPKKFFKLQDDYTDDPLIVFPVSENAGSRSQQVNGDFIFGKTAQGIVIRPVTESAIIISPDSDDIKIKKTAHEEPKAEVKNEELQPIYPFKKWPQLSGDAYREAEKAASSVGKTEHANFLFSQGMYAEANLRLKGFDYATPNFLRAAGNFLTGRYTDAATGFDNVKLEPGFDNSELLMWKIAANEMLSRHNPAAAAMPDIAGFAIPKNIVNYPDNVAARVLLPLAEAFVKMGELKRAEAALAAMPAGVSAEAKNYALYVQGQINFADNKKARALEMWQNVLKADTGRESRAKASYAIIMDDLEAARIKPAEAAAKLDKLQIVWRGDKFEYDLLVKLGSLYTGEKSFLKALKAYRAAVTKFPDFPDNDRLSNEMRTLFAAALSNETDEKTQAFADLTVYYDFKELLPVGDEGDRITMGLVDKLARFDLFEEAAKLLESTLPSIKDTKKRAEFTTRASILYFMDRQPQKALDTLKASEKEQIPAYLREERIIVATRSLIEIGDLDAALIAAGGLDEGQKNRIRAEIYWKKSDWAKLVESYKYVEDKTEDDVLKLAIANSVLGNKTQLRLMRGLYGDMMSKSTYADSFDFVTNTENINYRDLAGSLKIDETEKLIGKFRERIKTQGVKGLDNTAGAATPAASPATAPAAAPAAQ